MPTRSRTRSIRASVTTGYWGAAASNSDAGARRRAARRARGRSPRLPVRGARPAARSARGSGTDAVDDDADGTQLKAEQALDRRSDRDPHLRNEARQRLGGTRDDHDARLHGTIPQSDPDRSSGEGASPRRAASPDPQDARHLERRPPDHVADDRVADGEPGRGHAGAPAAGGGADDPPGFAAAPASDSAAPATGGRNVSPISSGRRARAAAAPTAIACFTIRRFARPWVMITVPRTPSSGDPPRTS